MALRIKSYLHVGGQAPEVRYFSVPQDVSTSYEYLIGKIRQIFPALNDKDFKLFWRDNSQEFISFSSDEELTEALSLFPEDVFKLSITVSNENKKAPKNEGVLHPGVVCDGCDASIIGTRFKCLQCFDYDLCSGCDAKGVHVEHDMARIRYPKQPNVSFGRRPWGRGSCRQRFQNGHPPAFFGPFAFWEEKKSSCSEKKCNEKAKEEEKRKEDEKEEEFDFAEGVKRAKEVLDSAFLAFMSYDPEAKATKDSKTEEQEEKSNEVTVKEDTQGKVKPENEDKNVTDGSDSPPKVESSKGSDTDYVLVEEDQESNTKPHDRTWAPNAPLDPNHSRLQEALSLMEAMGFHNEDGWLAPLIVSKDYDVGRVINTILPVARPH